MEPVSDPFPRGVGIHRASGQSYRGNPLTIEEVRRILLAHPGRTGLEK